MKRRTRLLYLGLLVLAGLVTGTWLFLASSWGLGIGLRLASAALPGKLTVAAYQGSLLGPVQLSHLSYQDQQLTLSITSAKVDWRSLPLLYGKLSLNKLILNDLKVDWHPVASPSEKSAASLRLPVSIDLREALIRKLEFHYPGLGKPIRIDEINFSAHSAGQKLHLTRFEISAYRATARISGEFGLDEQLPVDLRLALHYDAANGHSYNSKGSLQGDMQRLTLHQELAGSIPASLHATAEHLTGKLQWDARLEVPGLNPHSLVGTLPNTFLGGVIEARGDLEQLKANSDLQFRDEKLGTANLKLHGESDIAFNSYQFTVSGRLNNPTISSASVAISGKGNRNQVSLDKLTLEALHGTLDGKASLVWMPQLAIKSDLRFSNLHPGDLFKDWPGEISGHLLLERKPANSILPINFNLLELKGSLRKQKLSGEIRGSWAPHELQIGQLDLKLGDGLLQAKGQLARRWDLGFQFRTTRLEKLLPAAKGQLELSGRLGGSRAAPHLQLQAQGNRLAYAGTRAKSLHLNMDMGMAKRAPAVLNLDIEELRVRGEPWHSINLQSSGSNVSQQILLQAHDDKARLQMQLHGGFSPWQWRGTLDSLDLETPGHGVWKLQTPASIELASHRYRLSKLCITQGEIFACGQVHWNGHTHEANIEARQLPVALLNPWLPQQLKLDGVVNLQGSTRLSTNGRLQGQLDMQSPDKSISLNSPETQQKLLLGPVHLQLGLDYQGLHGQWTIPLSAGGGLQAQFNLPKWTPSVGLAHSQAVNAQLNLDSLPAEAVTRLIPDLARARGKLQLALRVAGSLGAPQVSGNARWQDGTVAVPLLGLNVRDVSAELKTARPNTLEYQLSAHSGAGNLNIDGRTRLLPDRGWPTTIRLHAQNLEVSNIPEAYVVLNSDSSMEVQGDSVNINGDLTIPQARLKPQTLPEGAVSASPDVVVIRKRHTRSQQPRWKVTTRLRVQLGDKVEFHGFGIRGKLRGGLLLTDAPGKLLLGQGELNIVDGMYRMRGRDLTIRRGRLIFSNTFIDDPALDVEAVRYIENVTAGVRIKGTLKQPQLTVFSEPAMQESEVLSYLILGHSLSQTTQAEGQSINRTASALGFIAGDYLEKGIGGHLGLDELRVDVNQATQNTSLVVGKYLSPKLYLRYYNGIAQSSRLVQLQYQLSRRVQIQTESGYQGTQSITGGDIFFTIEY